MIVKTYSITCDNCGGTVLSGEDTVDEASAIELAIDYEELELRKVPNGSTWHLCGKCSLKKTEELR